MGNKSDLRDPGRKDHQVSQERAVSFAKLHSMMFFETSAKKPPIKRANGQRGSGEYQQDNVEDIVLAVGATLKRHLVANGPASNGSFRVMNKRKADKELWTCC